MQVAVEAVVNAPPEVAFRTTADISTWPRFISAIAAVEVLTPGPIGADTRFRETRVMFGRRATEEMTVAEFEPPQRLVLTAFNNGTAYRVEHAFAPEASGTRLRLEFEGRPVTLTARLLTPLGLIFIGTVKRQLESDVADLAREAERRAQGAGWIVRPAPS